MIITEQKPLAEIIDSLKNATKVFLIGCGECSATCKTGGEPEVKKMQAALEAQSKVVVGYCIPGAPCVAAQIKTELAKHSKELRQADAVLVLACGLGVQSVKDNDRLDLVVCPACNSLFGGALDAQGNFVEKCSMCGECILNETGGICPITLCPKGLLNGPCGGVDKGKCEVDKDKECAWVLIYKEAQKRNKTGDFRKIKEPKDYKKTNKPRKLVMAK